MLDSKKADLESVKWVQDDSVLLSVLERNFMIYLQICKTKPKHNMIVSKKRQR